MQTAKRLEGIGEYYFSQKLREISRLNSEGRNIINLGIGSPDLPPHPEVIKVLSDEAQKPTAHGYQSYKGSPILRKAITVWYEKWYGVTLDAENEVLPLIGSKEGIMHICMTWLEKGDQALVPDPGYPTYSSAVKLAGGRAIPYSLRASNDYSPDFDQLERKDLSKVKIMFANYPQMPTGQPASMELFERFVQFGKKHDILVVHDNPYSFLLGPGARKPLSMLGVKDAMDTVVELNSLSKSHNMAGWRIGMMCGAKQRIDEVLRFKSNMDSGMFLPLQLAAAKALSLDDSWYEELNSIYEKRRTKAWELLKLIGCRFSREQAGLFAWGSIGSTYADGFALSDRVLYEAGVFITPGSIFGNGGKKFIRISLCAPVEVFDEAITRIKNMKNE